MWFFGSLVGLLMLVYILLWLPPVQRFIINIAIKEVTKLTNSEISIGDIRLRPFNRLKLTDVYAGDLRNDTLLYVKDLRAEFSLWPLLRSELQINSVQLNDFTANINADSIGGNLNFQFFIDAFSSGEVDTTTSEGTFVVNLNNIELNNGRVTYDIIAEPAAAQGFDFNHILVDSLLLSTDFNFTSVEDFVVRLRHLSLNERSGFTLQALSANVIAANSRMLLNDFIFQLPKSEIRINDAYIDYSQTTFDSLVARGTFSLPINNFVLHPSDVEMFYPPLANMSDSLILGAEVEGTLPAINLESFYLIYGRALSLDANAYIESYTDWENAPMELNIAQLLVDPNRFMRITNQLTDGGSAVQLPVSTSFVNLKAFLKGILPDMQVNLTAITQSGQLALNGRGGYVVATGDAHADAKLAAANFNLGQLLANPMLGIASLNADVNGAYSSNGNISGRLTAQASRFDFNGYSYEDIDANALYLGDSAHLFLESRDSNAPLWLDAVGERITSDSATVYLQAQANHVRLDTLNFTPQYPGADLYANIQAEVHNFDIDRMNAFVSIDSLNLRTARGVFYQDSVRITMQNQQSGYKSINIYSPLIEAVADGTFSFTTLPVTMTNSLAQYFNAFIPYQEVDSVSNEDINLYVLLRNTEYLSNVLELPVTIPDSAMVSAYYNSLSNYILLSAAVPRLRMGETELIRTTVNVDNDTLAPRMTIFGRTGMLQSDNDTMKLGFIAKALNDSVNIRVGANDPSDAMELYAFVDADVHFTARGDSVMPLIDVGLNPGAIFVNRQRFNILPATLQVDENRYSINGFELVDSLGGNLKVDGVVSPSNQDTLRVGIQQLYLSSIMAALRSDIDLKGVINADIGATEILSNPIVSTNYFNVDSISINTKDIGNLELGSAWNNQERAVMVDAELWQTNGNSSRINGYIFPTESQLNMNANMRAIELDWIEPITRDYLFGLSGELGLQLAAAGAFSSPDLTGELLFDNANIGVGMTNVQYRLNDTIRITPATVAFDNFNIVDNRNNAATINGNIGHKGFSDLDFNLNMRLRDLLLLNNPTQTDSMIYGNLSLNGNIDITGTDKNILAKASINNNGTGRVYLQMPESARTAQMYTGITYINTGEDTLTNAVDGANRIFQTSGAPAMTLPLRVELALTLTPQLTAGMVINAATGDIASVSGNGNIQLIYDMGKDELALHGDYTVEKGNAAFSFQNVLKREFQLAQGSRVNFRGDPMATTFNATAVYSLRADLATLDQTFSSDPYLSSSRVTVNCLIHIEGNLDAMNITYDIQIPNVDESVQRRIEGLLYNDDLKIKQIAYLLALGRFYPPEGVVGASPAATTWTSLLSSTLSSQLNNLLANVLNENWTVGTEFRAGEGGSDDIEANVIVSANLFDDRVTVTTNLGYRNTATATDDFTGDFTVEYKLTKTGEWVLKAYNLTNDQFYEQAPTTQGVGVVYKREAKTFKELFKKRRRRGSRRYRDNEAEQRYIRQQRNAAEQTNQPTPNTTTVPPAEVEQQNNR